MRGAEGEQLNKFCKYKDLKPDYHFEIHGDVAKGCLPDGTSFLIDKDKMELVSQYWFHINDKGYIVSLRNSERSFIIRLHWLVLGYLKKPSIPIDHINRDKTDCRLSNLRAVTIQQNSMNRKIGRNNNSGYLGAFYNKHRKKYVGKICISGNQIYLHCSDSIVECAQAYNYASQILFGEFAGQRNGVPEPSDVLKEIVEKKCEPYIEQAKVATQLCGHFL